MNAIVLFVIILWFGAHATPTMNCNDLEEEEVENYYWRDYKGIIPKDALPGGINCWGNTTYMGQVLHGNQIIPARIDPDAKKVVTYEWGYKEYEGKMNIKILCTTNKELFEWIDTGNGQINKITDKNFLVAGYEDANKILLLGRKLFGKEIAVGKVIFTKTQSTLNTTKDGKGIQHAEFQVLTYTSKKKKHPACNIDVRAGFDSSNETNTTEQDTYLIYATTDGTELGSAENYTTEQETTDINIA